MKSNLIARMDMMETVYVLTARETGEVFSSYSTEEKAEKALEMQEDQDIKDETFEKDFYRVLCIWSDDVRFLDAVKWCDR